MAKKTELKNLNDKHKMIILIIFFLSNTSSYLLGSGNNKKMDHKKEETISQRQGFQNFIIRAYAKTELKYGQAVMISNKKGSFTVPLAIINQKEIEQLQADEKVDISVYLEEKYISKLLNKDDLVILPVISNFKTAKNIQPRKSYEINY